MLPFIHAKIVNLQHTLKTLVDTGCQQTVISEKVCRMAKLKLRGPRQIVAMLNGETECGGEALVEFEIDGVIVEELLLSCSYAGV